mgnify:CR=1 FL=1
MPVFFFFAFQKKNDRDRPLMNTDYEVHIMPRHMLELKLRLDLGLRYLIFFCSRTYLLVYLLVDNILSISMLLIKNQAPLE